ncbi:putative PepSY domain-containing protein [uncultured Gammaproteobacteria bacterium]
MSTSMIAGIAASVMLISIIAWRLLSGGGGAVPDGRKSKEEIIVIVQGRGYTVEEIEFEDGHWVVEAKDRDDHEFEIEVDPVTGKFIRIERD